MTRLRSFLVLMVILLHGLGSRSRGAASEPEVKPEVKTDSGTIQGKSDGAVSSSVASAMKASSQ